MRTYLLDLFQKKESFDIEKAKELKPLFSFLTVLTDFLTIIKYRKKDINNILLFAIITQYTQYHLETASKKPNPKFMFWDIWISMDM